MKKIIYLVLLSFGVSGCITVIPPDLGVSTDEKPVEVQPKPEVKYSLAARHWSDVASIRAEAERLALRISYGEIDKVEAAKLLNKYRIRLVGRNIVDDSVFQVYLNAAMDSSTGQISNEQSKNLVKNALIGWSNRWKTLSVKEKPQNPAFTNFLNEMMGLPPLK